MTLFNKIKWILGILLIFLLVLTTNLVDRQNFNIVSDSIETVYTDRVVAQGIIYDLVKAVGKKEIDYLTVAPAQLASALSTPNKDLEDAVALFAETKLTPQEKIVFSRLTNGLKQLRDAESEYINSTDKAMLTAPLANIREQLDELSEIQLTEGRREFHESKRAISAANLFTQLEIGALIVMALCVQVIILYTPKKDTDA